MNRRRGVSVVPRVSIAGFCEHRDGGASGALSYRAGVFKPVRPAALRWVFLVVLALGIVGMHHLAMPGIGQEPAGHVMTVAAGATASAEAGPACCDGMGGHDMSHLCLAVLCAAAALLLSWLLLRRLAMTSSRHSTPPRVSGSGRSPPTVHRAPVSLSCLCVLRL
jgi:hypothetical protein